MSFFLNKGGWMDGWLGMVKLLLGEGDSKNLYIIRWNKGLLLTKPPTRTGVLSNRHSDDGSAATLDIQVLPQWNGIKIIANPSLRSGRANQTIANRTTTSLLPVSLLLQRLRLIALIGICLYFPRRYHAEFCWR